MDREALVLEAELKLNLETAQSRVKALEKNLKSLLEQRDRLSRAGQSTKMVEANIRSTSEALRAARENADKATLSLRRLGTDGKESLGLMDNAAGKLVGTLGAIFSLKMAKDFASKVMSVRGEFQQLEIAFETMLGSKEKAEKMMAEAVDLAAKTPFDLQGVAAGAKSLLAYGMDASKVTDTLRRLGDVSAGLSLPLGRLTAIYGQTMVKGKLQTRDLIRYQAAGVPILDELAKMYGKNTNQIRAMVTAGKVGFADVEKVFRKMTDEGGKFANLMEKQSASITGRISNIEDAVDEMFNEIGKKSEGVIYKGLGAVASLVENYEKVGKVIGAVAAAYGVERAAMLVYIATQKVATASTFKSTMAKVSEAAASGSAAAAQNTLNKAILSNPYVIAAAAVAGLAFQIYRLSSDTSAAAKAQTELEKRSVTLDAQYIKEISTLKRLKGQLDNAEVGTKAWDKAKNELISSFGKYNSNLAAEVTSVDTLTTAYNNLTNSVLESAKVRNYYSFISSQSDALSSEINSTLTSVQNRLTKFFGKGREEEAGALFSRVVGYVNGEVKSLDTEEWKTLFNASGGFLGSNKLLNPLNTMVQNAQRDSRKLLTLTEDTAKAFGVTEEMIKKYNNGTTVTTPENKNDTTDKELQRQYNLKQKEIATLRKINREKEQMQVDAKQREIDLMAEGYTKSRAQNELNFRKDMLDVKRQREDKLKELQDEQKAIWQAANPDSKEFNFKTTITELPKEYSDMYDQMEKDALAKWNDANNKSYRAMVNEFGDAKAEMMVKEQEWDEKIEEEEQASVRRRMELQKNLALAQAGEEYANNGGSFTERYDALKKRLDAELALADDAHKEMKAKMNDLALAEFTLGENQEYGDVLNDVVPALKARWEALMATLPANLQAGSGRAAEEAMAGLAEQFASSVQDADFTKWYNDLGEKSLKALEKELERTQAILETESGAGGDAQALAKAELEIAALKKRIQELTNAQKTSNINWKEAADVINEAVSTFDTLGETIGGVAGEAISSLGGVVSATAGVVNGINAVSKAVSAAEKSVAILAVISAAIKVVQKVADIAKANEEANEAAAESARKYAQALEDLNDAARLDNLKNAFGSDGFATFKEAQKIADEARRAGRALSMGGKTLVADMRSGWQKFWGSDKNKETASIASFYGVDGNLDVEKLKAWNEQYGENLSDTQKKLVDDLINEWERYESAMEEVNGYLENLFGDTASSIAEAMVDAFVESGDALADLTDISNDFGKSLAKSMVTSTLMEGVFTDEAQKRIKDMLLNGNTAGAITAYNKLLDDANAKAPEITEFLRGLNLEMGGEADERSGESKGIAQASQDSVDELNGRATVIQSHTFQINENVKLIQQQNAALVANASDILNEVRGIHDDTGIIKGQMATVVAQQQKINSNVEWIIDKGVRAN